MTIGEVIDMCQGEDRDAEFVLLNRQTGLYESVGGVTRVDVEEIANGVYRLAYAPTTDSFVAIALDTE